uniref:Protein kinase domain-containing protein n=1 Tax=Romanomermis culicivorax TaxID=13658 RepID=A0A915K727_ROMCU
MSVSDDERVETLRRGDIVKDKYKVTGQIGFGSFGELYEAQSLETKGLYVAIKVEKDKVSHTKALNFELCVLQKLQGTFENEWLQFNAYFEAFC